MDNQAPPDELLALAITTETSANRLRDVYENMRNQQDGNPLLATYHDFDRIRQDIRVLHGTDNEVDYLVYADNHPLAGQEVYFDLAGYICSFNLPGNTISTR